MNLLVVALVFSQNGLQFMADATSSGGGYNPQIIQSIVALRISATNMARQMGTNSELLAIASNSSNQVHRVAAAFAYGMSGNSIINQNLFRLAVDNDDIVCQASRESMIYICAAKLNKRNVDFGPFPFDGYEQKEDAVKLWRTFFMQQNIAHTAHTMPQQRALELLEKRKTAPAPAPAPAPKPSYSVPKTPVEPNQKPKVIPNIEPKKPSERREDYHHEDDDYDPAWMTVKRNKR